MLIHEEMGEQGIRLRAKGKQEVKIDGYNNLLGSVSKLLELARHIAARSVNAILTVTYWEIGRRIVEFEQGGKDRAAYGEALLQRLSHDLVARFGRGFGLSNLKQMRKFYLTYETRGKGQTVSGFLTAEAASSEAVAAAVETRSRAFPLSWSHYVRLLALDDPHKRDFYEEEARRAGWSLRQFDRQINSTCGAGVRSDESISQSPIT
jgi:hypothetical protein